MDREIVVEMNGESIVASKVKITQLQQLVGMGTIFATLHFTCFTSDSLFRYISLISKNLKEFPIVDEAALDVAATSWEDLSAERRSDILVVLEDINEMFFETEKEIQVEDNLNSSTTEPESSTNIMMNGVSIVAEEVLPSENQ